MLMRGVQAVDVIAAGFVLLVGASCALLVLSWWSQVRLLGRPAPPLPPEPPPVSVLKPLRGADPGLEENLHSFFHLDYACYEILFGARDASDPALDVARRVAAAHPHVRATIVADARAVGLNPKVNNLANLLPRARHEMILISDSNVRVRPGYLRDLVANLSIPGVGLVSSPFQAVAARGVGGALEALQLDTFVMRGVALVGGLLELPCVVGKSMLLRRADLADVGGFPELARYLAEDQVCGELLHARGLRVVVSGHVIANVIGTLRLRDFVARHLRWARIRRRINVLGYAAEPLANPVALSIAGVLLGVPGAVTAVAATWALSSALAFATQHRLGGSPGWRLPFVELARSVVVAVTWPVPFFDCTIDWRGNRFRIGSRTLLEPATSGGSAAAHGPAGLRTAGGSRA